MNPSDDDLSAWQDDPVFRALTGPATSDELAGEEQMLAAFRATPRARSRRRFAGRFGFGAGAVVVAFGLSGGVAAAFTQSLPDSVQQVFHDVMGPLGVPAPPADAIAAGSSGHHHRHGSGSGDAGSAAVPVLTSTSSTPAPSVEPTTSTKPLHRPRPTPSPPPSPSATGGSPTASASPSTSPTDSSSPTDSPSPTASPTPAYGDPSTWTLAGSSSTGRVLVHGGVGISGRLLTADGRPVPDRQVALSAHVPGTAGATRIQVTNTDDNGTFTGYVAGLNHTTVFMLHAGQGVHSAPMRVVVVPTLATSQQSTTDGTGYDVALTSDGADPGDSVVLLRRQQGSWVQVGSGQLDGSGQLVFRVPKPTAGQVRYQLRLAATPDHATATTRFVASSS